MNQYCPHTWSDKTSSSDRSSQLDFSNLSANPDLETVSDQTTAQLYGGIASPPLMLPDTPHHATTGHSIHPSPPASLPPNQWSTTLQNLLDQPPAKLPRFLIVGGFAFCCAFGTWAWFGQVQEVSHAQGTLIPQGEVYKVQPVNPGEIARILTQEGQHVRAGEIIAELDMRLATAEVERLQQSLAAYRLQFFQTQGMIEQNRLELETRRAIAAAETRRQDVLITQAKASTRTNQDVLQKLQSETEAYQARLDRLNPLLAAGAIAKDRIFEVEQALREKQLTMTQQNGQLAYSLTEADRLQAELIQKQAEGKQSELEAQQRIQQLNLEASEIQAKITETETLLKTAQTRLAQLYLYAPVDGTVSALKIKNRGEVIQPGQTVAEIIPDQAPLVLSSRLPNQDAGLVKVGMPVQLKFDAFPYQEYGIVPGEVLSISPDAETDEQAGNVYRLNIAVERDLMPHLDKAIHFKAGQTAQAEIVTRKRRIIEVLLDPIQKMRAGGLSF